MSDTAVQDSEELAHRTVSERVRDALVSGLAVIVPLVVTLIVVGFSVNFLSELLDPFVVVVASVAPEGAISGAVVKLGILGAVTVAVLVTGVLVQQTPTSGPSKRQFDSALARVPGIGTVYTSFVDISETLLGVDTDAFESVVFVELQQHLLDGLGRCRRVGSVGVSVRRGVGPLVRRYRVRRVLGIGRVG